MCKSFAMRFLCVPSSSTLLVRPYNMRHVERFQSSPFVWAGICDGCNRVIFFFFRLMCPQFNVLAHRQSRLDRIVMIVIIILRLQHSAMCAHIDTFFFFGIYKCLEWNCNNNNDDGRCSGVVL